MPGLAVVSVGVKARVSRGTEEQSPASRYLAHRQNIPSLFRDNVDRYKIDLRLGVSLPHPLGGMVDAQPVQSPHHEPAGFDLHPPEVFSTLHDEVVAMQVPVRQRQREAQACGLVHKSRLAQLALKRIYAPAPATIPDRALLGR